MVEILGADGVRVEVDAAEVHDPGELGRIAHDDLVGRSTRWEPELDHLDPIGTGPRRTLLEEEFAFRAVDEPFQRHRSSTDTAERAVGNAQVVANEVELGVSGAREEDLLRIADRHLTTGDLELFL